MEHFWLREFKILNMRDSEGLARVSGIMNKKIS